MPRRDPRFLCESCGYDLSGRAIEGVCPECGLSVAASSPALRTGSPWQRRGAGLLSGIRAWFQTVQLIVTRPRACWAAFEAEARRSVGFLVVTSGVGAAIPALGLLYTGFSGQTAKASYIASFFLTGWLVMLALSMIEFMGVRFIAGRRGWRVDAPVAACIVSHASVGWIAAGTLVALAWQVHSALIARGVMRIVITVGPSVIYTVVLVIGGAMVLGIVAYESLVYCGVRGMKFANTRG